MKAMRNTDCVRSSHELWQAQWADSLWALFVENSYLLDHGGYSAERAANGLADAMAVEGYNRKLWIGMRKTGSVSFG